jgi:hypothetical protein
MDISSTVDQIFEGKWPEGSIEPQVQLEIINEAADKITIASRNGEEYSNWANNFALWLGGIHPNFQVYAWQLIRRRYDVEILADDKTTVRLAPLEEKVFQGKSYKALNYKNITKYHWPKVFLDGSTQEERLEALLEEIDTDLDSEQLTGDLVLSGQARGPAETFEENVRVVGEAATALKALIEKYGKPNILFWEQMNRLITWTMTLQPELAILAMRSVIMTHRLPLKGKDCPAWIEFVDMYGDLIESRGRVQN